MSWWAVGSFDPEKGLALELEEKGYDWIVQEAAVAGV